MRYAVAAVRLQSVKRLSISGVTDLCVSLSTSARIWLVIS
ncbi:MAG: hypothetical protein JWN51_3636, partial [Phycisphaerales bacterium]|nr:hypothetical protein [Phycisphaerales bacterium]